MQPAEPGEFRILEPGNAAEHALLRAMLQLGLETDDVVERAELVVLAQLHDRVRLYGRIVGIGQADRLHRPVPQRLAAALRHHLDRQATVEIRRVGFPIFEVDLFASQERVDKGVVLFLGHRAVDVIRAGAAGPDLVVARLEPCDLHVDGIPVHDRRDGIEERQRAFVGEFADRIRQRRRGEGAGRDDHIAPIRRRQAGDLGAVDVDQWMIFQRLRNGSRKAVAIDRQRAASRHLVGVGRAHDQRAEPAHFGVQQPDRIVGGIIGTEGI